jgi:hypothetical protein
MDHSLELKLRVYAYTGKFFKTKSEEFSALDVLK